MCSLCRDAVQPEVEYDCENERTSGEHTSAHGLAACDLRVGHFISCINDNDAGLSGFGLCSFSCTYNSFLSRLVDLFLEMRAADSADPQ